jgi:hypothetical protein
MLDLHIDVRFKGAHTSGIPPAGFCTLEKRENLNPFVYQESAGRANPHNRYWNPGTAAELPAFPAVLSIRDSGKRTDLEPPASGVRLSASGPQTLASPTDSELSEFWHQPLASERKA